MLPVHVPVMKGNRSAFTCLGNWYDLENINSLRSMFITLGRVGKRDYATGVDEYLSALKNYKKVLDNDM